MSDESLVLLPFKEELKCSLGSRNVIFLPCHSRILSFTFAFIPDLFSFCLFSVCAFSPPSWTLGQWINSCLLSSLLFHPVIGIGSYWLLAGFFLLTTYSLGSVHLVTRTISQFAQSHPLLHQPVALQCGLLGTYGDLFPWRDSLTQGAGHTRSLVQTRLQQ